MFSPPILLMQYFAENMGEIPQKFKSFIAIVIIDIQRTVNCKFYHHFCLVWFPLLVGGWWLGIKGSMTLV